MDAPTYDEVLAAQPHVYAHMRRSPLLKHPLLDEWIGRSTWVKHENHNPTGSFKIRGGLNLAAQMSDEEKRGVDFVLAKPYTVETLRSALAAVRAV